MSIAEKLEIAREITRRNAEHIAAWKGETTIRTTEFFKTLKEAEGFRPICRDKEIYSLDKPGTVLAFISERDHAIYNECRNEAKGTRAVVIMYR